VAVDGTTVYWTNYDDGTVMKCPVAGCTQPALVASGQSYPSGIAVDGANVYWINSGTPNVLPDGGITGTGAVMKAPVDGGVPMTLASALVDPWALAIDSTNVYWGGGAIMRCALAGCGGKPTAFAAIAGGVSGIVADDVAVYWTGGGIYGFVQKAAVDGGAPVTVASSLDEPEGIAVGATGLYWTEKGAGRILRASK
jgi:hypothetical protein